MNIIQSLGEQETSKHICCEICANQLLAMNNYNPSNMSINNRGDPPIWKIDIVIVNWELSSELFITSGYAIDFKYLL